MHERSATLLAGTLRQTIHTMQPKVVLVVSRTHWRCLTCKVLNGRVVSIDQHLKSVHPGFGLSPTGTPASSFDRCCHSDGELDNTFQFDNMVLVGKSSVPEIKKEMVSQNVLQLQGNLSEQQNRHGLSRLKRKVSRSLSQRTRKRQKINRAEQICSTGGDSDEDYLPNKDTSYEEENRPEEQQANKEKSSRRSRASPRKKLDASQKTQQNGKKVEGKQEKTMTAKKMAMTKALKQNSVSTKVPKLGVRGRKGKQSLKIKSKDICEDSQPVVVKEDFSVNHSEGDVLPATDEKPVKVRQLRKPHKPNSNNTLDGFSGQMDKSKIATSCVPWLLDSGRKAGDKVNKKPRRTLLPEEKQAVRELYGISPFEQHTDTSAVSKPRGGSQHFSTESQSINMDQNFTSHHPDLMVPVQRTAREEDPAQRNYMLNMFSPGTRDFFMDSARTHDSMYPSYSGLFPQQQQQQPHYTPQAPEFYPPAPNIPTQTSNMMNFQGYTQTTLPILSTPDLRHQMDGAGYLGQDFNITSLPQSHGMSAPASSTPHPASLSTQSSTHTNYSINTDSVPNSQPHATTSVPQSQHREEALDSNPDNQCRVCEEKFQSSDEYNKHQKEAGHFGTMECKRCRCKFHGIHELNLHVFSIHETEKSGFCFICNQDTAGMETLERHVHKHAYNCERQLADMRFHDCRLCCEELRSSYSSIRTHYYQHHVAHVCSDCFMAFKDFQAYKDHCGTHEGRPVFCSICGSKFESVDNLDQHTPCSEDIWAEDGKGDQCFKCGLWCPNRAVVEAHRKQHRSQEDVEAYRQGAKVGFPCVSCEKVFKNKHACRRHIKMVHEGVSCYKHYCEYCGKGFLTKGHMRDHIALHHLKIKRYNCDYCDQQFVCGPTLRRHVRKEHTKHKPYQCQHCGERFFEKTPLQRHLTVHTGLAPFMCEHCGKGFYTKHSFTNHGSTHSTVKEFVCSGCQKGFTRKYNLQAHTKICKML